MQRLATTIAVAAGLILPVAASAQPASRSDMAYCTALADTWVRYVGHDESSPRFQRRAGDAEGYVAVAQCRQGDAASAIPTLEKKLTDAKFTLPARG